MEGNKDTAVVSEETVIVDPKDNKGTPHYVRCNSSGPFVNPTAPYNKTAKEINQGLRLNLGLPINPANSKLRKFLRFLNWILLSWWEDYAFMAWNKIPLVVRQKLTFLSWKLYFPIHRALLGRKTAVHPEASEEYHALTTFMYWGRLFPVTIKRMRFSLSQLSVCWKDPVVSRLERIDQEYKPCVVKEQEGHYTVRGIYVHTQGRPTERVIFWLYGGAFLSGDVDGNTAPADNVGRTCGMDVFLPTYRLLPECTFDDMLWDVALAYSFLVKERNILPQNIILFGISSGSGLCCRLLQHVAELIRGETLEPPYIAPLLSKDIMPGGAVLMCPFVDYTEPKGTFAEYDQHDLIVNQSVMEVGLPYFEKVLGSDENRRRTSPCYRNMQGLPPLCVVVSEHEVVYDQSVLLVNEARKAGVNVTLAVWKYVCHVFCFLPFVPEGQQSMDFVCDWIKTHGSNLDKVKTS